MEAERFKRKYQVSTQTDRKVVTAVNAGCAASQVVGECCLLCATIGENDIAVYGSPDATGERVVVWRV